MNNSNHIRQNRELKWKLITVQSLRLGPDLLGRWILFLVLFFCTVSDFIGDLKMQLNQWRSMTTKFQPKLVGFILYIIALVANMDHFLSHVECRIFNLIRWMKRKPMLNCESFVEIENPIQVAWCRMDVRFFRSFEEPTKQRRVLNMGKYSKARVNVIEVNLQTMLSLFNFCIHFFFLLCSFWRVCKSKMQVEGYNSISLYTL